MMPTWNISAVENLHGHLASDLSPLVEGEIDVIATGPLSGGEAYRRGPPSGAVAFELHSASGGRSNGAHLLEIKAQEDAERRWFSWRDKWRKPQHEKKLILVGLDIAFYWGPAHNAVQVFRAEWDQEGHGSNLSAHPHWHCDAVMGEQFSGSDIHFPMAGWRGVGSSPDCWRFYPATADDIRQWAHRVVQYMQAELASYPPSVIAMPPQN